MPSLSPRMAYCPGLCWVKMGKGEGKNKQNEQNKIKGSKLAADSLPIPYNLQLNSILIPVFNSILFSLIDDKELM